MSYGIRHVAVIGSGVMGGGIAAHVANAGIPCMLLDIAPNKLTRKEEAAGLTLDSPEVRNRIVQSGYKGILKARPPALFSKSRASLIRTGNLEDDLELLKDADLVIEVVVENLEIKQALFEKILPHMKDTAIIATNTSGIPLKDIGAKFSPEVKKRFLGMHFFNPPRWLKVLEVITTEDTDPELTRFVCAFGESLLGKGVVVCKDTPNFIANRVAAFDQLFILDYAINNGYTVEEVDAGRKILKRQGHTTGLKGARSRMLTIVLLQRLERIHRRYRTNTLRNPLKGQDVRGGQNGKRSRDS